MQQLVARYPGLGWVACLIPTLAILRWSSSRQVTPLKLPPAERKEATFVRTMEREEVKVAVTLPWSWSKLPEQYRKNSLLKLPTESFNRLLRKGDLVGEDKTAFQELWGSPQFVAAVDLRGLPENWIAQTKVQFGASKVLTV